jgi:hypothetical protein
MDRDTFIITVYCLVVEHYAAIANQYKIRRGGFHPALSDAEVITMEICGEYFKLDKEKDLFAYFRDHYAHFFPALTDRPSFVRQAANLWRVKAAIQERLVQVSGQAQDGIQPIDTLPLPVCVYTRAPRDRTFKGLADYGHCAAKQMDYYGFKLGLRISRCGMITGYPLLAARPHDINHLETLVEGFSGSTPADKGFIDQYRQQLLREQQQVEVITPARKGMQEQHPPVVRRYCAKVRKLVETVGSQLTERFGVAKIRTHDFWHYQHRLIRKVLAHTVMVFLNLNLGYPPLDLDGLVPTA